MAGRLSSRRVAVDESDIPAPYTRLRDGACGEAAVRGSHTDIAVGPQTWPLRPEPNAGVGSRRRVGAGTLQTNWYVENGQSGERRRGSFGVQARHGPVPVFKPEPGGDPLGRRPRIRGGYKEGRKSGCGSNPDPASSPDAFGAANRERGPALQPPPPSTTATQDFWPDPPCRAFPRWHTSGHLIEPESLVNYNGHRGPAPAKENLGDAS